MLMPVIALADDRRVVLVDLYGESVVWAAIEDSQQRRAHVCIDCRAGSPTRNRIFDQARHPSKLGAVLVELGAPEEGIVVSLISRWCDDEEANRGYREEGIAIIRNALLHVGDSSP
jgi:hypothetical protein